MPESYLCKYEKCDLRNEPCLKCQTDYVKVEIYRRIKSDHEGEMTEDEFNELVNDVIIHEELDDELNCMSVSHAEQLVGEYGLIKAIELYTSMFGMWDETPTIKAFLYNIIDDALTETITFENYKNWCDEN